jgi:glycine cleavage system H lipoate-binding protein
MFPWIYEFKWTAGHIIFLAVFFSVAVVIATTLLRALLEAWKTFANHNEEDVMWEAAFEDIPDSSKQCRHALAGEVKLRTCENGFDCRQCAGHKQFLTAEASQNSLPALARKIDQIGGLVVPLDRYYHRGHTWALPAGDGSITIGLDDFSKRVLGTPDAIEVPKPGTTLHVNGTACTIKKGRNSVRILSPVEGEVLENGDTGKDWLLKMKPSAKTDNLAHLLRGSEVRHWYVKELERLQFALGGEAIGMSLADGGTPVDDMTKACPQADWDAVWGELFLQP